MDAKLDFEEWSYVAKVDPVAFEARRKAIIDSFLAASHDRQRILGVALQREIDAARERATDAGAALGAIMKMLDQQMLFLGEAIDLLHSEIKQLAETPLTERNDSPPDR